MAVHASPQSSPFRGRILQCTVLMLDDTQQIFQVPVSHCANYNPNTHTLFNICRLCTALVWIPTFLLLLQFHFFIHGWFIVEMSVSVTSKVMQWYRLSITILMIDCDHWLIDAWICSEKWPVPQWVYWLTCDFVHIIGMPHCEIFVTAKSVFHMDVAMTIIYCDDIFTSQLDQHHLLSQTLHILKLVLSYNNEL